MCCLIIANYFVCKFLSNSIVIEEQITVIEGKIIGIEVKITGIEERILENLAIEFYLIMLSILNSIRYWKHNVNILLYL